VIILEGPDGGGKTTLIDKIRVEFDLPVSPRVVSKDTEPLAKLDMMAWVEKNVTAGFQNVIFDRHRLISEPIYGAVLRSVFQPGFDNPQWLSMMCYMLYHRVTPIIIYCLPPFEVVKGNVYSDEDNRRVRDVIRKIYALYTAKAAYDAALWGTFIYDYTQPNNITEIFRKIDLALVTGVGHHG
jgi:hypothetical protein